MPEQDQNPFAVLLERDAADPFAGQEARPLDPSFFSLTPGVGPSLLERFKVNMHEAWRDGTIAGASFNLLANVVDRQIAGDSKRLQQWIAAERARHAKRYDDLPESQTFGEYSAAFLGQLVGSIPTPESFIPGPRWLGQGIKGRPRATRAIEQGVNGGAINAAIDPVVQTVNIVAGEQESYDPLRTIYGAGLGVLVGGGFGAISGGPERAVQSGRVPPRPNVPPPRPPVKPDPLFVGDDELAAVLKAFRADGKSFFATIESTGPRAFEIVKQAAVREGLPVREDPAATFAELYVARPGFLASVAPELMKAFDAAMADGRSESARRLVERVRELSGQRRGTWRTTSLDGTLRDLARRQEVLTAAPEPGRSFHEIKRGEPDAPPRPVDPLEVGGPLRELRGQIADLIEREQPMAVDRLMSGQNLKPWTDRFATATALAREAGMQGHRSFDTLLDFYVFKGPSWRARDPDGYRAFRKVLDSLNPLYGRWVERRRQALPGENRATAAPEPAKPDPIRQFRTEGGQSFARMDDGSVSGFGDGEFGRPLFVRPDVAARLRAMDMSGIEARLDGAVLDIGGRRFDGVADPDLGLVPVAVSEAGVVRVGDGPITRMQGRSGAVREAAPAGEEAAGVARADGDDLSSSLPHFATPVRGQDGVPNTSRIARRIVDEAPQNPSVQAIVRNLSVALDLSVRQGRLPPGRVASYDGGVLRLRHVNDFPQFIAGAATHIVERWKVVDPLFWDTFARANARSLSRVSGSVGEFAVIGQLADDRSRSVANFLYLWMVAPSLVNKRFGPLQQELRAAMERRQPELLEALDATREQYARFVVAPSQDAIRGRIVPGDPKSVRQRRSEIQDREHGWKDRIAAVTSQVYASVVDDLNPIRHAVRKLAGLHYQNTGRRLDLKAVDDAYKLGRLTRGSHAAGHMDIMHGVVPYGRTDPEGPSLSGALEKAMDGKSWSPQRLKDFSAYTASLRLLVEWRRYFDGELAGPPDAESMGSLLRVVDEMDAANPQFRAAAMEVDAWAKQIWRLKRDAGLITDEVFRQGLQRAFYVPVLRDMSDRARGGRQAGVQGTGAADNVFRFAGSDRDIIDPIHALMWEAYSTRAVIMRNDVFKALEDLADQAGFGGNQIVERLDAAGARQAGVPQTSRPGDRVGIDDVRDAATLESLIDDDIDAGGVRGGLFRSGLVSERGEPIIYVWRGGERQALRLADGEFGRQLYTSLTQMSRDVGSMFLALVAKPSAALRIGVTASPDFMFANLVRDQVSAWILSGGQYRIGIDAVSGFKSDLSRDVSSRLYNQAGGIMGGANVSAVSHVRVDREIAALRRRGWLVEKMSFKGFLELSETSETATRLGLFKRSFESHKARGLTDREALVEAAFVARDYIDFNRRGARMLHARRMVTFLNAAIQGFDKSVRTLIAPIFTRNLTEQDAAAKALAAKAWARVSLIGLFGLGLSSLYQDDPEYEEISDYMRATNWMIKSGGAWVAIPKPFELAFLSNIFERTFEHVVKEDPRALERMRQGLIELATPPTTSPGISIVHGLRTGEDLESGREIVPDHLKALEPELQFTQWTSEIAKQMGEVLGPSIGLSPAEIDYMIRTGGGVIGRDFLTHTNRAIDPERASVGWDDQILTKRFIKDVSRGANSTTEFWSYMGRQGGTHERAASSYRNMVRAGLDRRAEQYLARLPEEQRVYALLAAHWPRIDQVLHPLTRAGVVVRGVGEIRRDLVGGDAAYKALTPDQKRIADDLLSRLAMVEARNALITVGVPGAKGRKKMDPNDEIEQLRLAAPDVATAIEAVLAKLPDPVAQATAWKDVRRLLLEKGKDATEVEDIAKRLAR